VNRELRKVNNHFLIELAGESEPRFFWKDAFRPLVNASIEASFADFRSYFYQQQKVDEQVHLGFDMAVVERHPILSATAGKVLFAGYLGIYGNTVVLDHGYGINTLYAHLSSIDVKKGDPIVQDQKLGNSGATGLAGGDHLHFSLLVQGVQTNPVEFWDQHWIQDHVYLRLGQNAFGQLE
jgi:murein DD-endopeptidase MepM/ murein hydrolase activator NlpD